MQDERVIHDLAREASAQLHCYVLSALNHDDDILWLSLYENGELSDVYDSFPTYFEGYFSAPKGGDATRLCKFAATKNSEHRVEEILRKPHNGEGYVIETERHADLVAALGLPTFSVGVGYRYLERGEIPEGLRLEDFKHC